jgi:oligosaccharide repeat unit polymerase
MYESALALSVLVFGFVAVYFTRHPAFSVFHPLSYYCAFHGFIFVFRPILAYFMEYKAIYWLYDFIPSPADKLTVVLAANVGFLSFAFFCLRAGSAPMEFKRDAVIDEERRRLGGILPFVLLICLPVAVYSLLTSFSTTVEGGASTMVMDKATGAVVNTTGNGYLADAQLMLASCGALIAWIYRFRLVALLPLIGFVIIRAGSGGRGPFITALTSVCLLYLYEKRVRIPGPRVMIVVGLMLAAFTAVGQDRGRGIRETLGFAEASQVEAEKSTDKFLEGMDFANLEYFEYLVYVIPQRSHTYDYFLSNLQLFTEPVPRVLWSGKPIGAPIQLFKLWDYGNPIGMTSSLPGAGWTELGWIGVIIWCGLWGHAVGRIYTMFVRGPQHSLQTISYLIFLPVLIIAYRDGVLLTIAKQAMFFFLPVIVWYLLARYVALPTVPQMREFVRSRMAADAALAVSRANAGDSVAPVPGGSSRRTGGTSSPSPTTTTGAARRLAAVRLLREAGSA